MNTRAALLLGALAVVAIAYAGWQRASTRTCTEVAASSDAELQRKIAALQAEREHLLQAVESARREAAPCIETHARAASDAPAAASPGPTLPRVRPPDLSPELRLIMARQSNGQVFRELGLSEATIEKLLPILAAQQERTSARQRPPDAAEEERNQAEVEAIIGPELGARYKEFKRTAVPRMQVRMVRGQLESVGDPLSSSQAEALLAALSKDQALLPKPRAEGEPLDFSIARFRAEQHERAQRMREDGAGILTPDQLKRLDEAERLQMAFENTNPIRLGSAAAGSAAPR